MEIIMTKGIIFLRTFKYACQITLLVFYLVFCNANEINIDNSTSDYVQNCVLKHNNELYDFSQLAMKDYFEYIEEGTNGENEKYYFSICHPLRGIPEDVCDISKNNSFCVSKIILNNDSNTGFIEEMVYPVAGLLPSIENRFKYEKGWIKYAYESPSEYCLISNPKRKFSVEINFMCHKSEGLQEDPQPMLIASKNCVFVFVWMTKAACPKKMDLPADIKSCITNFYNSTEVLNLHALHSDSYYNVSNKYILNICGPISNFSCGSNQDAAVCDISDPKNPISIASIKDMNLFYNEHNMVNLKYHGPNENIILNFICKPNNHYPQIMLNLLENIEKTKVFDVVSAHVCPPKPTECLIKDKKGNVYDLHYLYNKDGAWEISSYLNNSYSSFLLNICGPLIEDFGVDCGSGMIGACEVEYSNMVTKNLGLITSDPVVNDDGSITIIYTGGDQCGDTRFSRSTLINLYCSEEENFPTFIEMTQTCQYIFSWHTPAACPRHVVTGKDCIVEDSRYGHSFDLNPLRNLKGDYNTSDGEHNYLLNICGPLQNPCNSTRGVDGVCQIKNGVENSGGQSPGVLKYNDGTLTINFENGSGNCANGNRSSSIIFICDHNATVSQPRFFLEGTPCDYTFLWHTIHACPPHTVIDCWIRDGEEVYDLSPLSNSNMNEEYFSSSDKKKYVLNVCRSIVHTKSSPCPFNSGACIIDQAHKDDPINIGEVENGPFLEDNVLKLVYKNGDVCNGTHNYETLIIFKCSDHELFPQLITEENCKYIFTWSSPFACPKKLIMPVIEDGNCTVENPHTHYKFDLSPLKKSSGYLITPHHSHDTININVCGKVDDFSCESTGACIMKDSEQKHINGGAPSSNLQYHPGALSLKYENGDLCKDNIRWSTHISFICPSLENTHEGPVLVKIFSCTFFISWYTELACERRIPCYVDTGEANLDFSYLIKSKGNYEITNPTNSSEKFYINVCRPLNPIFGVNCPPGSSICRTVKDSEEKPISLGHPLSTPVYSKQEGSILLYTHGSQCINHTKVKYSSRIIFVCDESISIGSPILKKLTHDCQYIFEWRTLLACPPIEQFPDSGLQCQVKFEAAKTNINLSPLSRPGGYSVGFEGQEYKVNVCGASCDDGAGVCTSSGKSYGKSTQSSLEWDYNSLSLTYFNGDACDAIPGKKLKTHIFFHCDMSSGYGEPKPDDMMKDLECIAVFNWNTNITCMEGIYDNTIEPTQPYRPRPVPTIYIPTTTSDSEPQISPPVQHSSIATIFITLFVLFVFVTGATIVLVKSNQGRRLLTRLTGAFRNSGPTILLLDDQQL